MASNNKKILIFERLGNYPVKAWLVRLEDGYCYEVEKYGRIERYTNIVHAADAMIHGHGHGIYYPLYMDKLKELVILLTRLQYGKEIISHDGITLRVQLSKTS